MYHFFLRGKIDYPASLLIPLGLGFAFILGAFYSRRKISEMKKIGVEVEGVVYDNNQYHPTIRFATKKNEWITKEAQVSFSLMGFLGPKKGSKVKVYYDPNNPKNFVLQRSADKYLFVIFIISGIILLGLGLKELYRFFIKDR